jgi:RNA polymerase sigma-70 factor (ECF subfamily)
MNRALPERDTRNRVNLSELNDTELIELIVHGRTDALGELYDRYGKLIYSIAYRIVGDTATAEEVTLDVFQRVWERAASYSAGRASVSTWLSSMAHHRGIDQLRRAGSRPTEVNAEAPEMEIPLSSDEEDGPEGLTEIEMERERVRAALDQIPKDQRAVLVLAYFEGLTQREIVDRLGEPLGTVKTRLRLGMQKLRKLLENETG